MSFNASSYDIQKQIQTDQKLIRYLKFYKPYKKNRTYISDFVLVNNFLGMTAKV